MKYAADFRQEARAALQGKWPLAILVGLVAAILGGATSGYGKWFRSILMVFRTCIVLW